MQLLVDMQPALDVCIHQGPRQTCTQGCLPACTAAVFDGHGGQTSGRWLQEHLYEDVIRQVNASLLQPDPAAEPIPGRPGAVRSSKVQQMMVDVFRQADDELLQYLLGGFDGIGICSY